MRCQAFSKFSGVSYSSDLSRLTSSAASRMEMNSGSLKSQAPVSRSTAPARYRFEISSMK